MKKFFGEFKKFITRGNVVDMAVGVIVGSSFTAIVNGLSNNILKPVINWLLALIFGKDSLSDIFTVLKRVETAEGELDLSQSIYIDWGAFINAVINFFLIAFVLFTLVKLINKFSEGHKNLTKNLTRALTDGIFDDAPSRAERKEMKKRGIKFSDKAAVSAYYAEKAKAAEEAKAAAAEKARLEREANPTTEDLLKEIRDLLKKEN
jgi:large conductance mechanosensitive channel